jgi:hypothetical protein
MSQSITALIAVSVLVSAALWLSLRLGSTADLTVLPLYSRRRLQWWEAHAGYLYTGCALLSAVLVAVQLSRLAF